MSKNFEVCGFELLHLHTSTGSLLDGMILPDEGCRRLKENNQKFFCVTDHGSMAVVPQQIKACDEFGLKYIIGEELYVNSLQPDVENDEEYKKIVLSCNDTDRLSLRKSYHLIALAFTNQGYENLVQIASWASIQGIGGNPRRPRVTHEILQKYKEGIIFTSCCYLSEIGQAFDRGGRELAEPMLLKYLAMFGMDHFYLELMMLDFNKQKPYDVFLIEMHDKYHIPLTISTDCHYCSPQDAKYQRYMLMKRTKNTVKDIERAMQEGDATEKFFELQDQNLWMKSEDEMNLKWESDYQEIIPYDLFCQAKSNTVKICERAKDVQLDRTIKLPELPDAEMKLWEKMKEGLKWRQLHSRPQYIKKLREEYELICRKNFASYFLMTKMFVDEARRVCPELIGFGEGDEAVQVGRGSGVGFLTNYVLGITDADPIKHNLLSERFLSDARGGKQLKLKFSPESEILNA